MLRLHNTLMEKKNNAEKEAVSDSRDGDSWQNISRREDKSGEWIMIQRPYLDCKFFYSLSITSNLWTHA